MGDGKTPDLSGIWNPIRVPCTPSSIGADFGCSDVPLGVPIGLFDVTANVSEEGQPGTTSKLPYQPGIEASVQQHLVENRRGDPTTRCLPIPPFRQWADFFPQKIIQTADSVTILSEYMAQFRQLRHRRPEAAKGERKIARAMVTTEARVRKARNGDGNKDQKWRRDPRLNQQRRGAEAHLFQWGWRYSGDMEASDSASQRSVSDNYL
jgi:hypothetical protein